MKTIQPDRFGFDRRKKSRIEKVKFTNYERLEFNHWRGMLMEFLNLKLRNKKSGASFFHKLDKQYVLPCEIVRIELKHVFCEDWKCAVYFDDDTNMFFMHDLR